jgi:hypothetical protein
MAENEKRLGTTAYLDTVFAIPEEGNVWRLQRGKLHYHAGFLNGLTGLDVPHTFGTFGMTVRLFTLSDLRLRDGRLTGRVHQRTWEDGEELENKEVAKDAPVVAEAV